MRDADATNNLRALPEQCDLMIDRASAVLEQVFFELNTDKLQQFTALLDAPPAHNPGLERLLAVTAPWVAADA